MQIQLSRFGMSDERGFLPGEDPVRELPAELWRWEEIGAELPKLLVAGRVRGVIDEMPALGCDCLSSAAQWERAMMLLSYFGHAYVWGSARPADRLPAGLARPWHEVAVRLGRPPVLSYASYALHNWRRMDAGGAVELGNIVLLQNFLGGVDEEWFILVHVDIEAKAAPALAALPRALEAAGTGGAGDGRALERELGIVAGALDRMNGTMDRMPEKCDPYVYYHRVRPYLYGWKDQPALPEGLVYEGVEAYGGRAQKFRGETGAQSGIVPALDGALGVVHGEDPLRVFLREMREYMPPAHRGFVEAVESGSMIRRAAMEQGGALREMYNRCAEGIERFRKRHLEYAARYIHQQHARSRANPNDVGTGGTPFMPYLKKHLDETGAHRV